MKTEQEQIEEIAFSSCVVPHNTIQFLSNYMQKESIKFESCRVCEFYNSCQRIKDIKNLYKAGYRKASDVIDEFVERLKAKESPKLLTWEYGEGYSDCIKIAEQIAAEMRQEVNNDHKN